MWKNNKKIERTLNYDDHKWRKKKKRKSEDYSTIDGVLDLRTAKNLKKLQDKGIIGSLTGIIASGKESSILVAEIGEKVLQEYSELISPFLAVKIYRTSTLNFKRILPYIQGDIRFSRRRKGTYHLIKLWAQKEFYNLNRAKKAMVNVPQPITVRDNILVMEFLGDDEKPFLSLRQVRNNISKSLTMSIYKNMKQMLLKSKLIHADLSEYNILVDNKDNSFFIDMGQSVSFDHPMAIEWLVRDVKNILRFIDSYCLVCEDERSLFEDLLDEVIAQINNEDNEDIK